MRHILKPSAFVLGLCNVLGANGCSQQVDYTDSRRGAAQKEAAYRLEVGPSAAALGLVNEVTNLEATINCEGGLTKTISANDSGTTFRIPRNMACKINLDAITIDGHTLPARRQFADRSHDQVVFQIADGTNRMSVFVTQMQPKLLGTDAAPSLLYTYSEIDHAVAQIADSESYGVQVIGSRAPKIKVSSITPFFDEAVIELTCAEGLVGDTPETARCGADLLKDLSYKLGAMAYSSSDGPGYGAMQLFDQYTPELPFEIELNADDAAKFTMTVPVADLKSPLVFSIRAGLDSYSVTQIRGADEESEMINVRFNREAPFSPGIISGIWLTSTGAVGGVFSSCRLSSNVPQCELDLPANAVALEQIEADLIEATYSDNKLIYVKADAVQYQAVLDTSRLGEKMVVSSVPVAEKPGSNIDLDLFVNIGVVR